MELNKAEVSVVQEAVKKAADSRVRELCDLQLAYVGGGIGETTL